MLGLYFVSGILFMVLLLVTTSVMYSLFDCFLLAAVLPKSVFANSVLVSLQATTLLSGFSWKRFGLKCGPFTVLCRGQEEDSE